MFIWHTEKSNIESLEEILGIKVINKNTEIFNSVVSQYKDKLNSINSSLSRTEPQDFSITNTIVEPTTSETVPHKWIEYRGQPAQYVNYLKTNVYNKKNQKPDSTDIYVFQAFTSPILTEMKGIQNYDEYANAAWSYFFKIQRPEYIKIGKIFLANENNIVVYPYHSHNFELDPTTRDWWKAAFGGKESANFHDISIANAGIGTAGITKLYNDIEAETGNTDLNRTIFYSFEKYGRKYVCGADLRLSTLPQNSVVKSSSYILLGVLTIGFMVLLFLNLKRIKSPTTPYRVYKMQRFGERVKVKANPSQQELEFKQTIKIRNSIENREQKVTDWSLTIPVFNNGKAFFSYGKQGTKSRESTEVCEMTISKRYNLAISNSRQNLKAAELWSIYRLDDSRYARGVVEVLWLNETSQNELSTSIIFWDKNFSVSEDDIISSLKRHLLTSESGSFLNDQELISEPDYEVIVALQNSLNFFKDFALKFESYKNRLLLFRNTIPILEEIYKNPDCEIEATCGIEFLENLRKEKKIIDILGLNVKVRYIIEGENSKFKTFFEKVDVDTVKEFMLNNPVKHQVVEFKPGQEIIYRHRDFCILTFRNKSKCVLYTDMNDPNAQKGWISWRKVDIEFYSEILEYIKSGIIDKKTILTYTVQQ
jgi:hypothetical protein